MSTNRVKELEEKIAELKRRLPPHSVKPSMIQELDDLEYELEKAREEQNTQS